MKLGKLSRKRSLILIIFVLVGCNGTTICSIPSWYHDTTSNKGFIYANTTATDANINLAVDKAKIDATNILKSRLKKDIDAFIQIAINELDLEPNNVVIEQLSNLTELVLLNHLNGVKIDKRFVCIDRINKNEYGNSVDIYRAYVSVQYDKAFAFHSLIKNINDNVLLKNALEPTHLYDYLNKRVKNCQ